MLKQALEYCDKAISLCPSDNTTYIQAFKALKTYILKNMQKDSESTRSKSVVQENVKTKGAQLQAGAPAAAPLRVSQCAPSVRLPGPR